MAWSHGKLPGLYAPLILLLLRSAPSVAELTTSILHAPVLGLRQATTTTDGSSLPTSTASSTTDSPSSTESSLPTFTDSPLPTSTDSSTQGGNDGDQEDESTHVFNYYFLLIAIFIACLLLGFIFAGRRRKKRTAILMQSRHRALRQDIEGWPGRQPNNSRIPTRGPTSRYGSSRWAAGARNLIGRNEAAVTRHDEGLDESGEAPPPYNPSDKPPSISVERRASRISERGGSDEVGLAVPLRTLSRGNGVPNPPDYTEAVGHNASHAASHESSVESVEITRPEVAATPTTAAPVRRDQFGSDRRLLEETDAS